MWNAFFLDSVTMEEKEKGYYLNQSLELTKSRFTLKAEAKKKRKAENYAFHLPFPRPLSV